MSKELDMARELVKMLEEKENMYPANRVELSTLSTGEVFKIGERDFIVLEQKQGQTVVISKGFMAKHVVFDDNSRNYNKSSLKKLIESDIQPVIEDAVGADNLVEHEVDLTSVDMQNEFEPCTCKVRPITFDEARQYNDLLVNENLDDLWWTCTPWSTEERERKYEIAVVSPSGDFDYNYYRNNNCGVRPVCILKSNIFVSKGE